jgi:glycosyltransferase involved in cell wall biosynthesis
VVIACSWFLKYAATQAVGLSRAGADVAVLCRDRAEEFGGSENEHARALAQLEADGVEVLVLPGRITSASAVPSLLRLRRRLRTWAPDVVHGHAHNDPRVLLLAAPYPLAVTVHDPVPHPGSAASGLVRGLIERRWRREADLLVVHGEKLAELVAGNGRPVVVVPHGTEPAAAPYPVPPKPTVLLFGRLEPYKGLDVLLAAMEAVWRERPDVTLEVVGEGREAARLADHPAIRVRHGYLPESEVDATLARATLVVLPYRAGSQSGVGSLAVGRGIPTVVTDVGALPELVMDRSFVVPPDDPDSLAASLLRHIEHGPDLRRRVLEDAGERLSWEAVGRRSLELYRRFLLRDGSGGSAA